MEFNTYKSHDTIEVSARCNMGEQCSEKQSYAMQSCVTKMLANLCNAALSLDMQRGIDTSSIKTDVSYMIRQESLIVEISSTIDVDMSDKVFDMFSTMLMSINEDLNNTDNQDECNRCLSHRKHLAE